MDRNLEDINNRIHIVYGPTASHSRFERGILVGSMLVLGAITIVLGSMFMSEWRTETSVGGVQASPEAFLGPVLTADAVSDATLVAGLGAALNPTKEPTNTPTPEPTATLEAWQHYPDCSLQSVKPGETCFLQPGAISQPAAIPSIPPTPTPDTCPVYYASEQNREYTTGPQVLICRKPDVPNSFAPVVGAAPTNAAIPTVEVP